MNARTLTTIAVSALLLSTACDKGSGGAASTSPSSSATASTAAANTTTAPATTSAAAATSAAPAANLALAGTCTTKAGARVLTCTEYYGKLPDGIEAQCKKDDGTFVAGTTPCSTTDATGKCAHKATATANQIEVSYKTSVGDPKGSCEALGNTWTAVAADSKPDAKKK